MLSRRLTYTSNSIVQVELCADLVGLLFNWGLLGMLSLQTHEYVTAPHRLRRRNAAVCVLFLLELAQSICLAIESISDIIQSQQANFYWIALYIISPITCAATQAYYANQIVSLSRRHLWSGWIGTFCALNILSGTLTGVSLVLAQHGRSGPPFELMLCIWLGLNILADVLIVVSMGILLHRRSWACYGPSTDILTRLTAIAVQTGSLTAGCFIFALIFFWISWIPIFGLPLYLLSKLSACTLLACLNNPVLNGEDAFNNIDLRVIDDIDAADSAETVKVPLHSTVPAGAARYEDQSAGLGYVRYDSLHGRA